jgi:peptidoglycan/LPS O-acetylase OafA/YrhL
MAVAVGCSLILITALVCVPNGLVSRLFQVHPLPAIGLISYSLYLWHVPLRDLAPHVPYGPYQVRIVLAVLMTFAVAIASAVLVEEPILRRVKSRLRARATRRAEAAAAPA